MIERLDIGEDPYRDCRNAIKWFEIMNEADPDFMSNIRKCSIDHVIEAKKVCCVVMPNKYSDKAKDELDLPSFRKYLMGMLYGAM